MRLHALPYFLDFESVWGELDVSETVTSLLERERLISLWDIRVKVVSIVTTLHATKTY